MFGYIFLDWLHLFLPICYSILIGKENKSAVFILVWQKIAWMLLLCFHWMGNLVEKRNKRQPVPHGASCVLDRHTTVFLLVSLTVGRLLSPCLPHLHLSSSSPPSVLYFVHGQQLPRSALFLWPWSSGKNLVLCGWSFDETQALYSYEAPVKL